jgi:hypothetical protein
MSAPGVLNYPKRHSLLPADYSTFGATIILDDATIKRWD